MIISLIQHFEDDLLWIVILKILKSGIILKTFTHALEASHQEASNQYHKEFSHLKKDKILLV